jgi:ABC-2 type transport system permease protein
MRAVLFGHPFPVDAFAAALGLNAAGMVVATVVFLAFFRIARRRGALLQIGE